MNSFDNIINYKTKNLTQIEDYPITFKKSLELHSDRNNNSNCLSTSSLNNQSSILFLNKSTTNKNQSKFLYNRSITDNTDISKRNLEYDIQIASLKKKLASVKEQRKKSEMKVNSIKIRIKQLQNEEKASIKELENTKKSIQKIRNNRKKSQNNKKSENNTCKKNKKAHNFIKIQTLSFINNKNSGNFINNSYFKDNENKIASHHSFNISMKKNNHFKNSFTPKANYFVKKNALNNPNKRSNTFNDYYGAYSFKNTSINLDKIKINNPNNPNKNRAESNTISNQNKNINNKYNKIDLKSQIKKNLIKKLKQDEEERKRIQEEIRKIEKEQYNLWVNFNDNMNNNSNMNIGSDSNNNINNNYIINNNELNDEDMEDQDNILNYKFI